MSHNEVCSQLNVPFSWEVKPGVSKVTHEEQEEEEDDEEEEEKESSIDIRHISVNLPPPPRLSKSARFCVDDHLMIRSSAKKCNVINKQEDPFVAAYRKCAEYSINGKLGSDDKNDIAGRSRGKKNMFTLSCKYSCTVSSDNVVRLSQCSKEKTKEEQKEKDRVVAKLTGHGDVKCNQEKLI